MAITARCPGCGQTLSVEDQHAGMQGKCPTCNTIITFPATPNVEPAAVPPAIPLTSPAASVPLASPGEPYYGGGQPRLAGPGGLASLDPLTLTYLGLGIAIFCYLLLLISPLLSWVSI
jgi:phage FluMu protein Com